MEMKEPPPQTAEEVGVPELPPAPPLPPADEAKAEPSGFKLDREVAFYAVLILIAAVMRFWALGKQTLAYDESLHAVYGWNLFMGKGYTHDPMMHGPLKFHLEALSYFLFGATDYATRVLPAVAGTVLVGLPYFLRRELGRTGALAAAVLLAFSPFMLFYSRFIRDDIFIVVWAVLLAICMFRYMREPKPMYLYLSAAFLALSFTTMESAYIVTFIFGAFLLVVAVKELLSGIVHGFSFSKVSPSGSFFLLLFTLALPLAAPLIRLPLQWAGIDMSAPLAYLWVKIAAFGVLFLIGAVVAFRWQMWTWLVCALIFWGIYAFFYTTMFTNLQGFATGAWGSLDYWITQHGVQRGGQPWFYYLILLPLYSFLPLVFGVAGMVWGAIKGGKLAAFIFFWATLALLIYSYAGEKMPWLMVHIELPLILLAGWFIGAFLERVDWRALWSKGGLWLLLLLPVSPLTLRSLGAAPSPVEFWALIAICLFAVVLCLPWVWWLGLRRSGQVALLLVLALFFAFSLRASWQASYNDGDVPREMITYAQGSPDQKAVMREVDRLARLTGQGYDLPLTVDSDVFWGMDWYLRNYKSVQYIDIGTLDQAPKGRVVILSDYHQSKFDPYAGEYGQGVKFLYLWWPIQDYQTLTLPQFWQGITSFPEWRSWWNYFMYRQTSQVPPRHFALVYFPKDFTPVVGLQ
ncbi:MAG: TIGR03663 family protein [Dehalococcoidia bacterium]|nr:TIGR03663 family protein [Dehalococcoidia bacterium]